VWAGVHSAFQVANVSAKSIDSSFGVNVACLLEQEWDLSDLAALVQLKCPFEVHATLLVEGAAHAAGSDPSDAIQIDISYRLEKRFGRDKAERAWDLSEFIQAMIGTPLTHGNAQPNMVPPFAPICGDDLLSVQDAW
jgi:hypothetical protein